MVSGYLLKSEVALTAREWQGEVSMRLHEQLMIPWAALNTSLLLWSLRGLGEGNIFFFA